MFHIVHRGDQRKGAIATVEFEGGPTLPASPSFWATSSRGKARDFISIPISKPASCSPDRRQCPWMEKKWLPLPATPHRFTAIGNEPLDMVAIHSSNHFVIESLGN